ncbi:hypothetical protein BOQ60_24650, partial [Chryseobacterium sp. CH1]
KLLQIKSTGKNRTYFKKEIQNDRVTIQKCQVYDKIKIDFTESKFKIRLPNHLNTQENLRQAVENYYRLKAQEKIEPILRKKSKTIGLQYKNVKFM